MSATIVQLFPERSTALAVQATPADQAKEIFDRSVREIHKLAIDAATQVLLKEDPVKYAQIDTPVNLILVAQKAAEILMDVGAELQADVECIANAASPGTEEDGA